MVLSDSNTTATESSGLLFRFAIPHKSFVNQERNNFKFRAIAFKYRSPKALGLRVHILIRFYTVSYRFAANI